MMGANWIQLFALTASLECTGQLLFKKSATANSQITGARYYFMLARDKRVIGGLFAYGVEILVWLYLLSRIPLSIAFPLSGLQQLFLILCSFFFLNEKIDTREWFGASLIALGVSIIIKTG
jgi:drug/metabolite transporter (DMT)-like permease